MEFKTNRESTGQSSLKKMSEVLSEREKTRMSKILNYLKDHEQINSAIVCELTGKSTATVNRYLNRLCDAGVLEAEGVTSNKVYTKVKREENER